MVPSSCINKSQGSSPMRFESLSLVHEFEDPLPHAIRMSPSCFGFPIQSRHVQPIKSGHVPATSEFPAPLEFPFIALSAQIPTFLQS